MLSVQVVQRSNRGTDCTSGAIVTSFLLVPFAVQQPFFTVADISCPFRAQWLCLHQIFYCSTVVAVYCVLVPFLSVHIFFNGQCFYKSAP